jgi:hypothetical protein
VYHAGLSNDRRKRVQEQFQNGTIRCLAATIAFGMVGPSCAVFTAYSCRTQGLDKPDVRLIIHAGVPKGIDVCCWRGHERLLKISARITGSRLGEPGETENPQRVCLSTYVPSLWHLMCYQRLMAACCQTDNDDDFNEFILGNASDADALRVELNKLYDFVADSTKCRRKVRSSFVIHHWLARVFTHNIRRLFSSSWAPPGRFRACLPGSAAMSAVEERRHPLRRLCWQPLFSCRDLLRRWLLYPQLR